MRCDRILEALYEIMPANYAYSWDNVGLLAGRSQKEAAKVLVCLDLTEELIDKAIEDKVDLIVSHHPMIFSAIKQVNDTDIVGRKLIKLISADISYIAMHTNYDVAPGCMADESASLIGLKGITLNLHPDTEVGAAKGLGIGKVGDLKEAVSVNELAELIKKSFNLSHIRVFDKGDEALVSRIAISPGSGKNMYKAAHRQGADLLISGDISHHDAIDALELGIITIDAGHLGIEKIFIELMAKQLKAIDNALEIIKEDVKLPDRIV